MAWALEAARKSYITPEWKEAQRVLLADLTAVCITYDTSAHHNTLDMLHHPTAGNYELISYLQLKIAELEATVEAQRLQLDKLQAQPIMSDVRVITLKQHNDIMKGKLAEQQQQCKHQQQQLQECFQQRKQLSAESARLRSQLQASKQVKEPSYGGLTQPVWFQDQPIAAPSSSVADTDESDLDVFDDDDLDDDQVPDCSVVVVPTVAAKASDDQVEVHSIATKTAAAGGTAAVDTVVEPDTPICSIPQLVARTSSSSGSSRNSSLAGMAAVNSSNSSSSFFSCWWHTAAAAAAPAVASVSSTVSSCSSAITGKRLSWQSLLSTVKTTSELPLITGSRCCTNNSSNSSTVGRQSHMLPGSAHAAPASATMEPASDLHRSYEEVWWYGATQDNVMQ